MPKNKITKLQNGYIYKYQSASGERKSMRSLKGESRTEFAKRCERAETSSLKVYDGADMTFRELFEKWVDMYVRPTLSGSTVRTIPQLYYSHVDDYLGCRQISTITRANVYKVLSIASDNNLSQSTIRQIRSCISRPYNWAINTMALNINNPCVGLVFKAPVTTYKKSKKRVISPSDLNRIRHAMVGSRYRRLIELLILTGLRPSEALGLQARDIKHNHLEIRRGVTMDGISPLKTKNAVRDLPLTPAIKNLLLAQSRQCARLTPEGWLWPSTAGDGSPSMDALRRAHSRILRQTAIYHRGGHNHLKKLDLVQPPVKCTLYDYRHTFATNMANKGMPQHALMAIMGHSSINITMTYYIEATDKTLAIAATFMSDEKDDTAEEYLKEG